MFVRRLPMRIYWLLPCRSFYWKSLRYLALYEVENHGTMLQRLKLFVLQHKRTMVSFIAMAV